MRRAAAFRRAAVLAPILAAALCTGAMAQDGGRVVSEPEAPEAPDPDRFGEPIDLAYGAFQRGYYKTALELALPRAEAGDPAAQSLIGNLYLRGLGVGHDAATAAEWYEKAAEQGISEAQFQLAMLLVAGDGVEKDRARAYELLERAADSGHQLARFNYAQMVLEREPTLWGEEKAVSYYELAADEGLAEAQYAMAQVYFNGIGGKQVDETRAMKWLRAAAAQNFDTAQIDLGTFLVEGVGGERDPEAGFSWLMRAAQSGNPAAQNRVAKLYMTGIGTEPDAIAAASWYLTARRAGLVDTVMEDFLQGLTEKQVAEANRRAGTFE